MTVAALIQIIFAALVVITGFDWLRRPSRSRWDIWLMFVCLIIPALLPAVAAWLGVPLPVFDIAAILAIMIQPLLLLRLVQHFQKVPRRVSLLSLAAMIVTLVLLAQWGETSAVLSTATLVIYFLVLESYPIGAFWRAARGAGGVVRRRLFFATLGSAFLPLTIVLSGLPVLLPRLAGPARDLTDLSILLAAASYYVAFATPRPLRRAWQLDELYRFLRAPAGAAAADPVSASLGRLCAAATRASGALVSAAWLWEPDQARFSLRALDRAALPDLPLLAVNGPLGEAWHAQRPVLARRPAHLSAAQAALAPPAEALIAVPLITPERAWGVLEVYLPRTTLFPDDDLALLALLAGQTAEALAREAQAAVEHALFERLAQANAELQAEVAERRQAEAALAQRTALLEAANQELEAFSYSVSHDLRSPLRAIDGFSQALLEDYNDQLDETAQDYLMRIRRGAQRMALLIDDLLRLAWLSRATLTIEPLDLTDMARSVLAELRAAEPGRVVEAVVAEGLTARGDARLLRVALENLLGNAWKFTSREPHARLEVSAGHIGGQPVYCVRDNGAGFDMSSADRLFGAFQRMHTLEEFPGTGIGLAIVQRIVLRHAGRIWAESAPGQGAAFYFMLGAEGSV